MEQNESLSSKNSKPLFPSVSIEPGQSTSMSSSCLFPSVQQQPTNLPSVPQILPQCSSFPGVVELSDDSGDDLKQSKTSRNKKSKIVIDLSSNEDISSNDSSVELIDHSLKRKHKKKKKKKKSKHKKHKSNEHDDYDDRKDSKKYDNSYLEYLPRGAANFIDDIPNLKPEDAFRLDRRGDNNNRAFDKLYEKYVPKYFHKDVIYLDKSTDGHSSKNLKKSKRYFLSKKLKESTTNKLNYVFAKENLFSEISNLDFIRIDNQPSNDNQQMIPQDQIKFKSLEDFTTKEMIGPLITSKQQLVLELTKTFNQNLYEDKSNVQQWIDFIKFQDLINYYGVQNSFQNNNQDSLDQQKCHKISMDRMFEICNKALDSNRRSIKLNLLKLKLLSSCFDDLKKDCQEVDSEWKNVCFLFPNAPEIWFEWLYFSLRCEQMSSFKANTRTRKIFRQAFGAMSLKILEGQFQTHQIENLDIELILINLTHFLAEFFASIDQFEKAIGIFQALIEFNLCTPNEIDLDNSFEEWFIMFEQFWDSGVSRIGEFVNVNESGWNYFQSQIAKGLTEKIKLKDERNVKVFGVDDLMNDLEDEIINKIQTSIPNTKPEWIKSLCWIHLERMRHCLHWLPANVQLPIGQSLDDVEDPERIVLSDEDIKPFLYRLRRLESKFYLSIKFLQFLNVQLITFGLDSAYSSSRYEIEFSLPSLFPIQYQCSTESISKIFEISKKFYYRFENYSEIFVLKRYRLETILDGDYGTNVPLCDEVIQKYDQLTNNSREAFVENLFEKLCHIFKDSKYESSLYLLWIQYKISLYHKLNLKSATVKKFIKEIIRRFKDNMDMYNVYCNYLFEIDVQEAIKTSLTTIQVYLQNNHQKRNVLRMVLSFVRNVLNLDSIVDQFINNDNWNDLNLVPKSQNHKSSDHLTVIECNQIALNALIACICDLDPSMFSLDQLNRQANSIQILKTLSLIEKQQDLEHIQSMAFILYLTKDFSKTQNFLEQYLLPDSSAGIEFETKSKINFNKKHRLLERSFYLLYMQLMLREYLIAKRKSYGSITLKQIRSIMNRALITFPDDPLFLSAMAKIETKFPSLMRTRKFFNDFVTNSARDLEHYLVRKYLNNMPDDPQEPGYQKYCGMQSIYNIFMATLHSHFLILDKASTLTSDETGYDFHSGMSNRIRNLFEKALNLKEFEDKSIRDWEMIGNGTLAHCPTIWRLFIRFEEGERRHRESILKKKLEKNNATLYRALQMCPNHKPLYLDVIVLKPDMLQECLDIMISQQLRVRTTIEEINLFIQSAQTT